MSDLDTGSGDNEDFRSQDGGETVEFGWDEEAKELSGRRLKAIKEKKKKLKPGTFDSMGLSIETLKAIKRKGYRLPTPIQRKAMPLILQGLDVIGMARTGSGKTAAFVIPMLERLKAHSPKAGARAVILAPTRELALQTHKNVRELSRFTDLRTAMLVGGDAMEAQFAELAQNPDIIVATPGRLLHHLVEVEGMSLRTVEYVVFDEADRLFEMGFADQVRDILSRMPDSRQTLMFSATLPRSLADFAQAGLQNPQLVRLDMDKRISPELKLAFFTVRQDDKVAALLYLLREVVPAQQLTILFAATRHHVEYLYNLMQKENIPAACVFGSMDQTARKIHIAKFRAQKVHLLITTDVAARGIDIPLIDNVINLDFPPKPELFTHRVGRAARAGRSGTAYSLFTREELPYLLDLHLYLGRRAVPCPEVPDVECSAEDQEVAGVSLYGSFPQVILDPLLEHLRSVEAASAELAGAQRSLQNAYGLYLKTRPPASAESAKRAHGMPAGGVHPLLLQALPKTKYTHLKNEAALAEFTQKLKSFRPTATVLEAEIASIKSTFGNPLLEADSLRHKSNEVMQRKRALHSSIIKREREKHAHQSLEELQQQQGHKRQRIEKGTASASGVRLEDGASGSDTGSDDADAGQPSSSAAKEEAMKAAAFGDGVLNEGRFRDKDLYISHVRDGLNTDESFAKEAEHAELQAAVLDLTGEDQAGMNAQRRQWHWDKRKKKYVQLGANETVRGGKRIRTESGKSVDAKLAQQSKGIYKKWVKQHHVKVAAAGTMEDQNLSKELSKRFHPSMRHKSWKSKGAAPVKGGELKTKEQVRKERQKTEKRKAWLQQKQQQKGGSAGGKKRPGAGSKGGSPSGPHRAGGAAGGHAKKGKPRR